MMREALTKSTQASLSREQELVIASVSLDPSKDKRIYESLENTLDWTNFIQIANQQGILPICCQRLKTLPDHRIPSNEINKFKEIITANNKKNLRLAWKLVECVNLLADNGVEYVVLKGPIFALQAYNNLSLRQFWDLDILIHPIDFPKAYDLLQKSGYVPKFKLGNKQKKFLVGSDNQCSFYKQGDTIEVHWGIAPQENISSSLSKQMWKELKTVQIVDENINTLSPENTILSICIHGAKHGWKQLKWIVDLAYYSLLFPKNSWPALLENAKQYGLYRQVCLGLLLAEGLVNAFLPAGVHDQISKDRHAQVLASKVRTSLFNRTAKPTLLGDYIFYFSTRERLRDRIHYFIDLVFVPKTPDWMILTLPESLYFLYYFFRPARLMYLAGKAIFSSIA